MNQTPVRKDITAIANKLLLKTDKQDLCVELGMSRPTLNVRLKDHKWKPLEIKQIERINAKSTT